IAEDKRYVFALPMVDGVPKLITRSAIAGVRAITGFSATVGDRRRLGIAVGRIAVSRDGQESIIPADDDRLDDGWWAVERNAEKSWRWTNGEAVLPIEP